MKRRRTENMLALISLNLLRLCVKYHLDRKLVLPPVPRIILDHHDQAIPGPASASDRNSDVVRLCDSAH
jgi:hypothetical protein